MTGLDTWSTFGQIGDYVSTDWRIWSGQPGVDSPIASGNSVASVSLDGSNFLAAVSGLSVSLDAGHYWIGYSHRLTGSTPWTYVESATDQSTVLQLNGDAVNTSSLHDAAFRIHATAVPEAGTAAMMAMGLGMLGFAVRRRQKGC